MPFSCHRRESDKIEVQEHGLPERMQGIAITQQDAFDFSSVDTGAWYYGTVGETDCFVKVDSVSGQSVYGRYFAVDSSGWTSPSDFEITRSDGDWFFRSPTMETNLWFNIQYSPFYMTGTFRTTQLRHDIRQIQLEIHTTPDFKHYESVPNMLKSRPDTLPYHVQKNRIYGNARGYWVSNPEHEDKYVKIITKSILKTFWEKDLDLTMDVYTPEDSLDRHPLIVFLHGGAFYIGDKGAETMTAWCSHFASMGYVTASVNYRMGFKLNKASIQQCGYEAVQDARAALRHLAANAAQYRIDTDAVFIAGTSAGAITALAAALWKKGNWPPFIAENGFEEKLGALDSSGNNLHPRFRIRGIANMWGAVYNLDELNGSNIPVISFHGTADNIVPYREGIPFTALGEKLFDKMYGSEAIHERLNSLQVRNEFHPLAKAGHGPYQDKKGRPNACYYFIQEKIQAFFREELLRVGTIRIDPEFPMTYILNQNDTRIVHWKAEGGFILSCEGNRVRVVWRSDAPKHRLTASGIRENGAAFCKTVTVKLK